MSARGQKKKKKKKKRGQNMEDKDYVYDVHYYIFSVWNNTL